jgi:alpha-glucosidase
MQLSAWYPMYHNHNSRNTITQEAYRWATTAEATRRVMNIRYSLLPYTYTLFYKANSAGETVLRALPWEFPADELLKAVETQFMSGPAILVTPVLEALATSVRGVFPGIADGTIWYDWYTLAKVDAAAGENKPFGSATRVPACSCPWWLHHTAPTGRQNYSNIAKDALEFVGGFRQEQRG